LGDRFAILQPLMAAPARSAGSFSKRLMKICPQYRAVPLSKRATKGLADLARESMGPDALKTARDDSAAAADTSSGAPEASPSGGGDDDDGESGDPDSDSETARPRFAIEATAHNGLIVETADGRRATLAVLDEHGNQLSGDISRDVFSVCVRAYRQFLMGSGHLVVHSEPPAPAKPVQTPLPVARDTAPAALTAEVAQ
jgi:hypothetical protein